MASVWVEKLKSGRWRVQWREADGTKPSQSYDTRGEAMRAKREQEVKIGPTLRGRWRKMGNRPTVYLTIAQISQRWRETREGTELAKRPGGDRYMDEVTREAVRIAAELGWTYSRDANPSDVADLKRRRKNRGTARPLSYLRLVLRWGSQHQNQPLDVAADAALRAPQSRKATLDLLTERQAKAILARARRFDLEAPFSCLLVYGWRAISACRLRVGDVDLQGRSIRLAVKQSGEPWRHPLFGFHVDQLRKIIGKRPVGDPLFLSPYTAEAWTPAELVGFYRRNLRPAQAQAGNTYALKRFAISRMESGAYPWTSRLAIADIQLFTGHKTKEQVLRYLATSFDRARDLVAARGAERGAGETGGRHPAPPVAGPAKT